MKLTLELLEQIDKAPEGVVLTVQSRTEAIEYTYSMKKNASGQTWIFLRPLEGGGLSAFPESLFDVITVRNIVWQQLTREALEAGQLEDAEEILIHTESMAIPCRFHDLVISENGRFVYAFFVPLDGRPVIRVNGHQLNRVTYRKP